MHGPPRVERSLGETRVCCICVMIIIVAFIYSYCVWWGMSTTTRASDSILDGCRPVDATPVTIDAASLESTSTNYLRELKTALRADGYVAAEVTATARFDEDCSLATQETVDRVRSLVDAAAFLGADTLSLSIDAVADPAKARPALNACAERARREGVELEVDGAVTLS